jgi:hypothetical protein
MASKTATTALEEGAVDRALMESLSRLSSCESAREAAAAWLKAFESARASGQDEARANATAGRAVAPLIPVRLPTSSCGDEVQQPMPR